MNRSFRLRVGGRIPACPKGDSLSYADTTLLHVTDHRQVTDAYLASPATSHGARLATFDEALARTLPQQAELIP